jgi:hypothetical protein
MSRLDWKWIGIGVAIMLGLSIVAGLVLALALGSEFAAVTQSGQVALSGTQLILAAVLSIVSFALGGYIVAVRSAGRTILEPGISAAIAVALALLLGGNFSLSSLLIGGLVPFFAGLFGGWVGERRHKPD